MNDNQRERLKQGLRERHELSIQEFEQSIDENFQHTPDFWECHQCRRISYDLLHGTFTPGPTFNIDTHLQRLLLKGFYTLFPDLTPSNLGLTSAQTKKKEKLQNFWRFLFLNSCHAIRDRKEAISLSMDSTKYNKDSLYHCRYWSYGELRMVVDASVSAGLFRKYTGQQGDVSFITRLQITDQLKKLIDDYADENRKGKGGDLPDDLVGFDLIQCMPLPRPERIAVVIKHEDGSYTIPSRSNRDVDAMCKRVERYNRYMREQDIVIHIDVKNTRKNHLDTILYALHRGEIEINPDTNQNSEINPPTIDTLNNSVLLNENSRIYYPNMEFRFLRYGCQRIFTCDMKNGGRFYGVVIQNLPEEIRSKVTINGCPVVELDFKAIHPSLLYSSIGIQPPQDIYIFENAEDKQARDLMKLIGLIPFNASTEREAFNAIRMKYKEKHGVMLTNDIIRPGVELFFDHNPDLKQFYLKGSGGNCNSLTAK